MQMCEPRLCNQAVDARVCLSRKSQKMVHPRPAWRCHAETLAAYSSERQSRVRVPVGTDAFLAVPRVGDRVSYEHVPAVRLVRRVVLFGLGPTLRQHSGIRVVSES